MITSSIPCGANGRNVLLCPRALDGSVWRRYYYNKVTGQTSWTWPPAPSSAAQQQQQQQQQRRLQQQQQGQQQRAPAPTSRATTPTRTRARLSSHRRARFPFRPTLPLTPCPRAVHAACLARRSTRLAGRPRYARHTFFPVPPRTPQAAAQAAQLSASSTAVTGKSTGEVEKKKRRKKLETVIMEADQLADDDFQVGVRVARTNGNAGHDTTGAMRSNRLSRAIGKLASWCRLRQCVHLLLLGGEERGLHTLQDGLSHH